MTDLNRIIADALTENEHGHHHACTAILRSAESSPAVAVSVSGSGETWQPQPLSRVPIASLVASLGGDFHAENLVLQALEELAGGKLLDLFNAEELLALSVNPVHAEWIRTHLGEK